MRYAAIKNGKEFICQKFLYFNIKSKIMANTYHQMYIQAVFAVKYREAVIEKIWKQELFGVIGNLINETECNTILVNGVEDHVHCFFGLLPKISVSDILKNAKAISSKWINKSGLLNQRLEGQKGFGCFSYSHSHTDRVFKYVQNQEAHHKKETFKDGYTRMLRPLELSMTRRVF